MVTLIHDIQPITETDRFDAVMLATTIYGELENGFQKEIAEKYPYVNEANIKQPYGDLRRLGTRLTIHKGSDPTITLLYTCCAKGQFKYALDMDAYIHSLKTANNEFKGMRVLSPIIGATKWDGRLSVKEALDILEENTSDMNLFIFDSPRNIYSQTKTQLNGEKA